MSDEQTLSERGALPRVEVRCPLCESTSVQVVHTLQRAELVDEWLRWPGVDISGELQGYTAIPQQSCCLCGLVFFPGDACGSGKLYEDLQRFPWYYMVEKWEYGQALQDDSRGVRLADGGTCSPWPQHGRKRSSTSPSALPSAARHLARACVMLPVR